MITPEQLAANPSEHSQQAALFCWAASMRPKIPELELLFAIPNGGLRDKVTASRLKAEGVRAGVPDIFWPVPFMNDNRTVILKCGLFIEMKTDKGPISSVQLTWLAALRAKGYASFVARGYEQARDAILNYYEGKPLDELRIPT